MLLYNDSKNIVIKSKDILELKKNLKMVYFYIFFLWYYIDEWLGFENNP